MTEQVFNKDDTEPTEVDCPHCGGWGEFAGFSYSSMWELCEACNGTGIEQ